ncbi:MAG: alpha-glucosidase C-terminal domain-containing protein [Bacteroidota bacterium]|nr:alpha-glucosidase C-terminal domain-containing protein [Bacteroidota bacterium]
MQFVKTLLLLLFPTLLMARNNTVSTVADTTMVDGHPAWIMQGNIYEVNVRQYTPEGTFKAFAKHLDRLKDMGVQTLWFMPINPISKVDRKGSLGSYYAVSDYTAINPEFGTMADWKALVKEAHSKGFKVIIDWVPNHTGADHYWLVKHPDFYEKDSTGKAKMAADWADTRKLDYNNMEMQDTMIAQMKFWITTSGIDGFRCDVASGPSDAFWKRCIPTLRKQKNIFTLAEGDQPSLNEDGFDATYTWNDFNMMKLIAKGERPASAMDSALNKTDATFPANTLRMFFTSNHDENTWNKADYETMPGAVHAPFAVLTQTVKRSVPLIYSGQEEPFLRAIRFFDKDTITFKKYARAAFYKKLLALHKSNPALSADASFKKVIAGDEKAVYAYVREKGHHKVLVVLNLSASPQQIQIKDAALYGEPYNVFAGKKEELKNKSWRMEPWGYAVYDYK